MCGQEREARVQLDKHLRRTCYLPGSQLGIGMKRKMQGTWSMPLKSLEPGCERSKDAHSSHGNIKQGHQKPLGLEEHQGRLLIGESTSGESWNR